MADDRNKRSGEGGPSKAAKEEERLPVPPLLAGRESFGCTADTWIQCSLPADDSWRALPALANNPRLVMALRLALSGLDDFICVCSLDEGGLPGLRVRSTCLLAVDENEKVIVRQHTRHLLRCRRAAAADRRHGSHRRPMHHIRPQEPFYMHPRSSTRCWEYLPNRWRGAQLF